MANNIFPTKGNLIATKKSLGLAELGFDLLDRKRNILIREMMLLIERAKHLQGEIEQAYKDAYLALERANITLGIGESIGTAMSVENGISIQYRSVMGVDIPEVSFETTTNEGQYSFYGSNSLFDVAYINFNRAKALTVTLSEVENSVYRLADAIKKVQRRANALKNINIPNLENTVKFIASALEEKEREEFSRLKVIRHTKDKKAKEARQ